MTPMKTNLAGANAQDVVFKVIAERGPIEARDLHRFCHQNGIRGRALKEAKRALQDSGQIAYTKLYIEGAGDRYFWQLTSQRPITAEEVRCVPGGVVVIDAQRDAIREKARQMALARTAPEEATR